MNSKLNVGGDASFNGQVYIGGTLTVSELVYESTTTVGDTDFNNRVFISDELIVKDVNIGRGSSTTATFIGTEAMQTSTGFS